MIPEEIVQNSGVTIAILAGGQSRRMGQNKSFVLLGDKPVFEHVLARLLLLERPVSVITNTPEHYAKYNLPMIPDMLSGLGTLGGIYTAIQTSKTDYTLCVACDMPFLNTSLLRYLIGLCGEHDLIVPRIGKYFEPLHAIYRKTCIDPIDRQLKKNILQASGFYDAVKMRIVEETEIRPHDPDLRSFMNLNTPDDLAAAQRMVK